MAAKRGIDWKALLTSLGLVCLAAFLGSLFTSPNVNSDWYESIKPDITPPNYVFPIVWSVLFFLIGLSMYFAWTNSKPENKKMIAIVFGINLALNIIWSILYFGMKNAAGAFIGLILLWISIIYMILVLRKIDKTSACLLIPYLLWVSFAGILNLLSVLK